MRITERINRKLPKKPVAPLAGGIPGSTVRPALEFTKAICHVLALDPAVEDAVLSLKRNMLRLIGVTEYSAAAEWTEPSVSYVLPGFICKSCNHCRDIDLGRDNHQNVEEDSRSWFCPLCKTDYDNSEIENLLLDIITRKIIAYNLQDLQCKKCGQIKMENLTSYCSCAGDFRCIMSQTDLLKLVNTFHKIGTAFRMPALTETIDDIFTYLT